jgi:hypothetical protein
MEVLFFNLSLECMLVMKIVNIVPVRAVLAGAQPPNPDCLLELYSWSPSSPNSF